MTLLSLSRHSLEDNRARALAPVFDVAALRPGIVHIGLGGFHRAHMARYTHDLMAVDPAAARWGIVGAGLRVDDRPLLGDLAHQDGLYTLIESDGDQQDATIIGSLAGVIDASASSSMLLAAIDDPEIAIVSLTVTENGYHLDRATKRLDLESVSVATDLEHPDDPKTAIGILVEGLRRRRAAGHEAFTVLCCDNIQHNGDILRQAVRDYAERLDPRLAEWIDGHATFPNAMVDRITPVPGANERDMVAAEYGIADAAALLSEHFRQWVIEDKFVGDRPRWEKVGVQFVRDVAPYEFMKLRLLNGSHLAIAGLGQLIGYTYIHETVSDPLIGRYMAALMDRETGPTLMAVPGVDISAYKRSLIERFANAAIGDTVQRVNTDAPLNVLLDPIRDRLSAGGAIDLLALGLAAWLRRVRGTDDAGKPLVVRHPLAELLRERALAGGSDPGALLAVRDLLGDLGESAELRRQTGHWLHLIDKMGSRGALAYAADQKLI